jgi:hypothetical protein
MSVDPELVRAAVERNDVVAVRELLLGATEPDRRACAKVLESFFDAPRPASAALFAAVTGLTTSAAADRLTRRMFGTPSAEDCDTVAGVLSDRRPLWLAEFVNRKLGQLCFLGWWPIARKLVVLGTIDRPGIPEYTTGMIIALHRYELDAEGGRTLHGPLEALVADPGLLDDEIWRLFTAPDAARWLAHRDAWADALIMLSEQGRLPRDRLLDACLDALTRDFAPASLGWQVTFHDRMKPSPDEMACRAGTYLGLLVAGAHIAVALGQKACGVLLEAGRLPVPEFLAASRPALLFPRKTIAMKQLKLIGKVATTRPEARARALATAAEAFSDERTEMQEAALRLIAQHGVPEGPERMAIHSLAGSLAPSVARDAALLSLLAQPQPAQLTEAPDSVRTEPFPGEALPPPLDDPDELIQLLTRLMEDPSDALAVERAMAGAVRLCALPAADRARLARRC